MKSRTIALPGGVALDYVESGDPHGLPVLLLHGYSDSRRSFEPLMAHLPRHLRVLAVSQRGHGDSGRPLTGYHPRDFADDAAALLGLLGISRAVVVGHSMGSVVARLLAGRYPRLVAGLVLVGAFHDLRGNPAVTAFWDGALAGLADPVPVQMVREFQRDSLSRPVPEAFFETVVAESLKMPASVWRAAMAGLLAFDPGAAGPIRADTLLVWGDRDGFAGRGDQERLLGGIPGARLLTYRGTGHAPHWEEPARFARDLAEFATGVTAGFVDSVRV